MSSEEPQSDSQRASQAWEDYEKQLAVQTLTEVARIRRDSGLTVKDLAGLLAKVGWPISVSSLNGMLDKRKSISLGELMAFAAALRVNPINLVYPTHRGEVLTLPGQTSHPLVAIEDFSGGKGIADETERRLKEVAVRLAEALSVNDTLSEQRRKQREELRRRLAEAESAQASLINQASQLSEHIRDASARDDTMDRDASPTDANR